MNDHKSRPSLIALFTDFGPRGIYTGQMEAVIAASGTGVPVIELCSDAPVFNPRASAYLLAGLAGEMPDNTLFVCVVDPGVGGDRRALSVRTGRHGFVGPDNGLLSQVVRHSDPCSIQMIDWIPTRLSDAFHGRDLFAPTAARLALGEKIPGTALDPTDIVGADWPMDLNEIIYADHYGNLLTGLRASQIEQDTLLEVKGQTLSYRRTFCEAQPGEAFWHADSIGLVEISVNGGRAEEVLGLKTGDSVVIKGLGPRAEGRGKLAE